jgi:hypothetical protein
MKIYLGSYMPGIYHKINRGFDRESLLVTDILSEGLDGKWFYERSDAKIRDCTPTLAIRICAA